MIRLKLERKKRGLSQARLYTLTGITPQDISALENGWRRPFPGWKKRIAQALDWPEDEIDKLFEEVSRGAQATGR